jgi:hypothetical protein
MEFFHESACGFVENFLTYQAITSALMFFELPVREINHR